MKTSKIFLAICTGILALAFVSSVCAYASYDYNPRYGGKLYVSAHGPDYDDYGYHYYGSGADYSHTYHGDYDYGSYGYGRRYDYDSGCRYFDRGDLRTHRDRACEWIENGDGWREETLRYRILKGQSNDYDDRYNMHIGENSEEAFYYNYDNGDEVKPSSFRNKHVFDPRIDNEYVMGDGYYYYEPRYDYQSGTYNWRF